MANYQITVSIPDKQNSEVLGALKLIHAPQDKEKDLDYLKRLVKILLTDAAHEGLMRQMAQRMTIPGITT